MLQYMAVHPVFAKVLYGALTGLASGAHVDLQAFLKWKSFNDAAQYGWSVALWRWVQGAAVGAATAGGVGWLFS